MKIAAATYTYNETFNLPIWIRYYGKLFGLENLFILDRCSTDGSTSGLDPVNVFRIPRISFDEKDKTAAICSLQRLLLSSYDAVICTDCDEILVVNPSLYENLADFIIKTGDEYHTAIGLDLIHVITKELPLDSTVKILHQRRYAKFSAPECKTLLSKIPLTWLPGLHSCDQPPKFSNALFLFHLKTVDYAAAMHRQVINNETVWSEESLTRKHGAHHRWDFETFVMRAFFDPINLISSRGISEFEFSREIADLTNGVEEAQGFFRMPMNLGRGKMVEIPSDFSEIF